MLQRTKVFIVATAAIFLALSYWGCNRLTDTPAENKPPEVHFVNIPLDSTTFNFAPIVRWYGSDPDGLVDAFQYHDDSTDAAVQAYEAGDAALQDYIAHVPATSWVTTFSSADTIYLRRAENATITQHVFMLRCVDNQGAYSPVKVRTFFRTNNPPDSLKVKWALDVTLSPPHNYDSIYTVPDTLFWGDTLTSTYGGIGFLWEGQDPDTRALNIIPLTYSYLLRNVTTGRPVPFFLYDDSNHVIGSDTGWSPWSGSTQVTFSGANFIAFYHDLADTSLDGHYEFLVRVRDDGLTLDSSMALATFNAVSAIQRNVLDPSRVSNYERGLLLVDWTKHPTAGDLSDFGLRRDEDITAFYNAAFAEGLTVADEFRNPLVDPDPIQTTFDWYLDKDLSTAGGGPHGHRVPLDYIRHYKWVWILCDNARTNPPDLVSSIIPRITLLQDYMKVGGQVVISGRGVLRTLGVTTSGSVILNPTKPSDRFLRDYFNLTTVTGKPKYQASEGSDITDFGTVTTTELTLSNLELDPAVAESLNFSGGAHFTCLPEIEFFGRAPASNGTDYSVTLFNYGSCSVNDSFNVYNIDCDVSRSTPAMAWLKPAHGHNTILAVGRVYNRTRQVLGEFIRVDREQHADGTIGDWRIVVSTPAGAGAWQTTDTLEVNYTYVPIQPSNDQPVAANYIRLQSVITYNRFTGGYSIGSYHRFRSGIFTFPLSFMKNDPMPGTNIGKVSLLIAYEAQWFNSSRVSLFNLGGNGGGGLPQP